MEISIEGIISFMGQEEQAALSIIDMIDESMIDVANRKTFSELYQITEKNIKIFERLNQELSESERSIQITTVELDDFKTPLPKKKSDNYDTILLFLSKAIDSFIQLANIVNRSAKDAILKETMQVLIKEKERIKVRIDKIYDKNVLGI